jgi:hypothetical protein
VKKHHVFRGVTIELNTTERAHFARAQIPTKYGPLYVQVQAPRVFLHELAGLFPELLASGGDDFVSGNFFSDITKGFDKLLKNKTFGEVTNVISQVADNPLLQTAATALGGPAGVAVLQTAGGAAKAAQSLAKRARRGDPKALQGLRGLSQAAKRGSPKAKRAVQLVRAAVQADREQERARPAAASPAAFQIPAGVPLDMDVYQAAIQQMAEPETFLQLGDGSVVPDIFSGCMRYPGAYQRRRMPLEPVDGGAAPLYAHGPGRLQYVVPVYEAPPRQAPPLLFVE